MRSRELQTYLADKTGARFSEIDQRTRVLRALNEISSGPRGLLAPHMNSVEIALHLLSLVSRRPGDTGDVVRRLSSECRLVADAEHSSPIKNPRATPASIMALAIQGDLLGLRSIEMAEHGLFAWATIDDADGRSQRLYFSVDPAFGSDAAEVTSIGNRYVIGAAIICELSDRYLADRDKIDEERVVVDTGATRPVETARMVG